MNLKNKTLIVLLTCVLSVQANATALELDFQRTKTSENGFAVEVVF